MIHLKQNIKQEDAAWVLEFVMPKQGWRIDRTTLGYVADAHNRIFEEQVGVSGCSCEFVAQHQVWYSRLSQYEQQIRDIAYPLIVTETGTTGKSTGRKSNTGKSSKTPTSNSGLTD
jgi:alkyl hydroperoxide reductase subunit AhpC